MTGRPRIADEGGMTLVEVMVAALILVVGISSAVVALGGSQRLSQTAERKEQALSYAQREIERFRALDWGNVGTQTLPTGGSPSDSSLLVVTVNGNAVLRINQLGAMLGQVQYQPLVGATPGGLPQTERITVGNTKATLARIVTYNKPCVLNTVCLGAATSKRVTVTVQLDSIGGRPASAPVVAETIIANPKAL